MQNIKSKKKLIIIISCVLAFMLIAGGTLFYFANKPKNVEVVPVSQLTMGWSPNATMLYGMVNTGNSQVILYDSEKVIKNLLVSPGDSVKPGDILIEYDNTDAELEHELKLLEIQTLEESIKEDEKTLEKYESDYKRKRYYKDSNTSYSYSVNSLPAVFTSNSLASISSTTSPDSGSGSKEDPYIYLAAPGDKLDKSFFEMLSALSAAEGKELYAKVEFRESAKKESELIYAFLLSFDTAGGFDISIELPEPAPVPTPTPTVQPTKTPKPTPSVEPSKTPAPTETLKPTETPKPTEPVKPTKTPKPTEPAKPTETPKPTESVKPTKTPKPTESVKPTKTPKPTESVKPTKTPKPTESVKPTKTPKPTKTRRPVVYDYTKSELERLIVEQTASLRKDRLELKTAKFEVKKAETELSGLEGAASMQGTVSKVADPAELNDGDTLIEISGGNGYYIETQISELQLDMINADTRFKVFSYNTGAETTGAVMSIDEMPSSAFYYGGNGNPNASSYNVRIYLEDGSNFSFGDYVELTLLNTSTEVGLEDKLYVEAAYIREDSGSYYAFVENAEGKLEKRTLTIGSSWYNYYEILSGLTLQDMIAFPYGKDVKEGAIAVNKNEDEEALAENALGDKEVY